MAPTITSVMTYSKDHLTLTHKQKKPLVERLRRERINSSIEQIKSLLGPEIFNQQPDSKLEKADILEMTVSFLRRLQQPYQPVSSPSCTAAGNQNHSRCVKEMVHFVSKEDAETQPQRSPLSRFQSLQLSSEKNSTECDLTQLSYSLQKSNSQEKSLDNSTLWRPWHITTKGTSKFS